MIAVSQYFEKKRAMAIGISVCGSGLGTLSLAPFSKYILDLYGWKGAHFILGKTFQMKTFQLFAAFIQLKLTRVKMIFFMSKYVRII